MLWRYSHCTFSGVVLNGDGMPGLGVLHSFSPPSIADFRRRAPTFCLCAKYKVRSKVPYRPGMTHLASPSFSGNALSPNEGPAIGAPTRLPAQCQPATVGSRPFSQATRRPREERAQQHPRRACTLCTRGRKQRPGGIP